MAHSSPQLNQGKRCRPQTLAQSPKTTSPRPSVFHQGCSKSLLRQMCSSLMKPYPSILKLSKATSLRTFRGTSNSSLTPSTTSMAWKMTWDTLHARLKAWESIMRLYRETTWRRCSRCISSKSKRVTSLRSTRGWNTSTCSDSHFQWSRTW